MTLNDPLSDTLSSMLNSERIGKRELHVTPASKSTISVLNILKANMYIGDFKEEKTSRGNVVTVNLIGKINKCGTIKPRLSIGYAEFEKFEQRFLPAKGMGILIISTSQGMMTLDEAKEKAIGGKLVAYCY